MSAILAGLEEGLDLIVVPQERDEQVRCAVLKNEAQRRVATTLENLAAQLAYPEATVHMRAAEGFGQLAQG
jgi:ubiquinone biosynthesis protein COQ9